MATFDMKFQSGAYLINVHDTQTSEGERANRKNLESGCVIYIYTHFTLHMMGLPALGKVKGTFSINSYCTDQSFFIRD